MWDLIVSVPDHCLSFYFLYNNESGAVSILNQYLSVLLFLKIKSGNRPKSPYIATLLICLRTPIICFKNLK